MDDLRYGYEPERFINTITDQFMCSICTSVVRMPYECHECGSMFCKICLNQWLAKKNECPRSRCSLKSNPMKPIAGAL